MQQTANVRTAFLGMFASRAITLVLMLVGVAVLGRLLDPSVFGLFALLLAFVTFGQALCEFGLKSHLISRRELAPDDLSQAAGLSLAIAVVLSLSGLAAAFLLPRSVVSEPAAFALVPLSLVLLLQPLTLATEVLLQRVIDFDLIARVEVVRVFADVAIAVGLAASGFGVTALAWGFFTGHAAVAVSLLIFGGRERRLAPRPGGWRRYWSSGSRITVLQILPKVGELATTAIVTALLGAATLGLLNRAQTIQRLIDRVIFEGILPVILPAMSMALARGVAPIVLYRMQIDYLAAICWPGFLAIAVLADPLVMLLLGPGWSEAVPGVRILALAGLGLPFTKMSQKFFIATGHVDPYLRITVVMQVVRTVLVLAAAMVSFEAVCLAIAVAGLSKALDVCLTVRRHLGPVVPHLFVVMARAGFLALMTAIGPLAVLAVSFQPAVGILALAIPAAGLGWLLGLLILRHPIVGEVRQAAGL